MQFIAVEAQGLAVQQNGIAFIYMCFPIVVLCALTWIPEHCNQLLADLLAGFPPDTTSISLNNKGLTTIPDNAFSSFHSLQNIDLSQNLIDTLGSQAFHGLTNLVHLDLSHNQIPSFNGLPFADLINLRTLSLTHNKIKVLPANIFHNVSSNLEYGWGIHLDLSNNEICIVHPDTFGNTYFYVDILNLDNNRISCLPDLVFSNIRIYYLLSIKKTNDLTLISGEALQMIEASDLGIHMVLSGNRISYIPANFTAFMPWFLYN